MRRELDRGTDEAGETVHTTGADEALAPAGTTGAGGGEGWGLRGGEGEEGREGEDGRRELH